MDRIDHDRRPRTLPRSTPVVDIAAVLGAICSRRPRKDVPLDVLRDRVLFETDVADTVLFLASDKSKFITAHEIARTPASLNSERALLVRERPRQPEPGQHAGLEADHGADPVAGEA